MKHLTYKQGTTTKPIAKDAGNLISLPKLIIIGGRFTGTSTLEHLLCHSITMQNVETIQSFDLSDNEQTPAQIKPKLAMFKACNARIDKIVTSRVDLLLGKWKSFNDMHDSAMDMI